jgi:hypothetical protein
MCARSILTAAMCLMAASAAAQSPNAQPHCRSVSGTVMTNLISQTTTLGTATGDLGGAVSADLLGVVPGPNGTTVFNVQHHWVTEAGDTIVMTVAQATMSEIAPGLFAVLSYPVTIQGGTGRFEGATGTLQNIGAVELTSQRTVFRYQGEVCLAAPLR